MSTTSRERTTVEPVGSLTKDLLFRKRPLRTKEIVVQPEEEYGRVLLAELMGFERDELDSKAIQRVDDGKGGTKVHQDYRNYRARACTFAMCNPDGTKMFPDATDADVMQVSQLPAAVIDQLFEGVDELSALTKKKQEAVGKDSNATHSNGSSSK